MRDRPLLGTAPTPRLAGLIAGAAALWLLPGRPGAIVAMAALVALGIAIVADWLLLPSAGSVRVTRDLPAAVGIGDAADGAYTIDSLWTNAARVALADEMPSGVTGGLSGTPGAERDLALEPGGSRRIGVTLTGARRGQFPLGRIGVRMQTRAGLLARRVVVVPGDTVLVTPSVSGISRFRMLAMQHRLHTVGVRVLRQRGDGRAFAGLREYAVGDDPRHIDWKATARRQKPIVREYSIEQSQTVFTLIESGRSMTQLAGEFSRLEHALSAALVLTDVAAGAGDRVGTLVFDDAVRAFVPPHRGRDAVRALRNALVPVTATLAEPDYASAFRFLAARQRRRSLIVFFTDVIDVRASRALLAHVTRSAARHLVVVVALRNDAIFAAAERHAPVASGSAARELALYESAAAEELIVARNQALQRMRQAGVAVLDVSPQAMTAAVVNRYLEIKARGAL
jgi:uncharacterized protein (DUF58 family)